MSFASKMHNFFHYLPAIVIVLIWAERMREVAAKRETVPGRRQEVFTFALFMICGITMFAAGITEYFLRGLTLQWPLFVAGLAASLASFVIRRKTIAALGKFWSLHVEMREGHEFVRSGPFRWMRHPVYFSMILELLGPALILGAWHTFAAIAVVFIPTLCWRLRIEEAALMQQFGADYAEYRLHTPMILPFRIFRFWR